MYAITDILLSPLFFFMQWLAEENILFTTCTEGTIKIIVRSGSFDHPIMSFAGYHLNDPRKKDVGPKDHYRNEFVADDGTITPVPDWQVIYHGVGNKKKFTNNDDDYYDNRHWILKHLGLYWVGWPWSHSVYVYAFEWNETVTQKDTGEEKILPRAEPADFIFVKDFVYAIKTSGAETIDLLPIDMLMLVTIAVRNPYRALFSGEDWLQRVTAEINRYVRTYVGSKYYQNLISPKKSGNDTDDEPASADKIKEYWKEFSQPILALNDMLPDDIAGTSPIGLEDQYGVKIRGVALQTMELSGTAEEKQKHQAATLKKYIARQEAEAITITATANGKAIEIKGAKEAEALAARLKVIQEYTGVGITLAGYDAVRESSQGSGNTIIWGNNPLTPLTEMLNPKTKVVDKS